MKQIDRPILFKELKIGDKFKCEGHDNTWTKTSEYRIVRDRDGYESNWSEHYIQTVYLVESKPEIIDLI